MNNRTINTTGIILVTLLVTYFFFYTAKYFSFFETIEKNRIEVIIPKSTELKEVSFFGINVSELSSSVGPTVLLNKYNIFLKETTKINEANFLYLNKSTVEEKYQEIKNNNFKLLSCFSYNGGGSYSGYCFFYKQENNMTNVYDEMALYFVIKNKSNLMSISTFKDNLKNNNFISILKDVDISKDLVLSEENFYTKNSVFNPKEEKEKNIFSVCFHFFMLSMIILITLFIINVHKNGNYKEREEVGFSYVFCVILIGVTWFSNPFDFLQFN